MTLTFSAYVTFLTNLDLLFNPFGYTPRENSIFNIILILSGLFGSLISARILDRENPKYKILFNALTVIGAILNALFLVTLPSGNKTIFGLNLFLYGITMIPTFSVIFPYVAELTYPINDGVSTAMMLFCCRLFATMFGMAGTFLAEKGFYQCCGFIAAATLIGMLPSLFVNEELRKVGMK